MKFVPEKPKPCKRCGIVFVPKTPHQVYCDGCRILQCPVCSKKFYMRPSVSQKNAHSYCSKQCAVKGFTGKERPLWAVLKSAEGHRGRKTGKFVRCSQCGRETYRYPRDLKDITGKERDIGSVQKNVEACGRKITYISIQSEHNFIEAY